MLHLWGWDPATCPSCCPTPAMDFCRIAVFFDYVRYPWAHQVHCFLMLDGRRLVCLMGYNVLTGRQSISTWHVAWWSVRADHNLPGQNLLVVAMNWRGVPPLREHVVFWHAAQFYLYDLARQVPQLRDRVPSWWWNGRLGCPTVAKLPVTPG